MSLGFLFRKLLGASPPGVPEATESREVSKAPSQTPESFLVRCGSVIGADHQLARINNQDSYVLRRVTVGDKVYVVGIVSDGCTGKKKRSRTEIGSGLLSLYAFSEIRMLLALGGQLTEIPKTLYTRCVSYIGNQARMTVAGSAEENAQFVQDYFLATLHGFIMGDEKLVTFGSGDGFYIVNDQVFVIDHNNAPLYMGYHLIDRRFLPADIVLPESFETRSFDLRFLKRFAVGTDGLVSQDPEGKGYLVPEEREAIFAHRRNAPAGLQWWLNIQQTESNRFSDDTTVITVEAVEDGLAERPTPENGGTS